MRLRGFSSLLSNTPVEFAAKKTSNFYENELHHSDRTGK